MALTHGSVCTQDERPPAVAGSVEGKKSSDVTDLNYIAFKPVLSGVLRLAAKHGVSRATDVLPRPAPGARHSGAWTDEDATRALAKIICHLHGLVLYGIEKLEHAAAATTAATGFGAGHIISPVAYVHIPYEYIYDDLQGGKVKKAELRSLRASSWTNSGRPKGGSLAAGDLREGDVVVFFLTDDTGDVKSAFVAKISWRVAYAAV